MIKVFAYQQGKQKDIGWHAEMPYLKKPKIRKFPKMIDGVKFYLGFKGEVYVAELFDKMFG